MSPYGTQNSARRVLELLMMRGVPRQAAGELALLLLDYAAGEARRMPEGVVADAWDRLAVTLTTGSAPR